MTLPAGPEYADHALILRGWYATHYPDLRVALDLRKVEWPGPDSSAPPLVEVSKVTGTLKAGMLEQAPVELDVYWTDFLEARSIAAQLQYAALHVLPGFTAPTGTIAAVSLLAGYAERPYANDSLYRFGITLDVTLHGRQPTTTP